MRKVKVSGMRERNAQTVLTFRITYVQTNFIISARILCTNFNALKNPPTFLYIQYVYALLMFSNSMNMVKIDGNMSEL